MICQNVRKRGCNTSRAQIPLCLLLKGPLEKEQFSPAAKKQRDTTSSNKSVLSKICGGSVQAGAGSDKEDFPRDSDSEQGLTATMSPSSNQRKPFRGGLSEAFYKALFVAV